MDLQWAYIWKRDSWATGDVSMCSISVDALRALVYGCLLWAKNLSYPLYTSSQNSFRILLLSFAAAEDTEVYKGK